MYNVLETRVSGHTRSSKMIPFDRRPMTSYRHSIATMGRSRTVSEINGDFGRKSQIFPTRHVFCAPDEGFPLELGIDTGGQRTRIMGVPGRERSLTISSAVWIQCTDVTDGRTDGQTPGDSKDRAYA